MNKGISDNGRTLNEIKSLRNRIVELEKREKELAHENEQLAQDEQKFRLLFERSLDGILLLEDGRFIDCNEAALKMLGFSSKGELMTMSPAELSPVLQPDGKTSAEKAEELIRMALDEGGARFEWIHKKRDGRDLEVEVLLTAITLYGKTILYTVWRDISARRSAEMALAKSEERYSRLFKNIPEGIVVFSMDGRITEANNSFQDMLGYKESELKRLCHHDIVPEQWYDFENQIQREQVLVHGFSDVYQTEYLTKDGRVLSVEVVTFLIRDSKGRTDGIWALVRNIEARKRAERELQQSEERFRALAEYAPFGLSIMNPDQTFDYFNPEFTNILGYTIEDLPDKAAWFEKAYPDEKYRAEVRQTWWDDFTILSKPGNPEPREFRVSAKNNRDKVIRFRAVFLADQRQLLTYEDVTLQKKAEEELIKSEEKYRSILDNIEEGYYETDLLGNFTFFNDALCTILGYSREELVGVNNRAYLDETNARKVYAAFNQVYLTGAPTRVFDWEFLTSQGEKHYVEASISLRLDDAGQPVGFRGIARDVTERRITERALDLQKAYAEELIENAPEAIVLLDTSDVVLRINNEFTRLFGYSREEVWGRQLSELIVPAELSVECMDLNCKVAGGERVEIETIRRRKDGTTVEVSVLGTPIRISGGQVGVYGIYRDISKRRRAEEALRQNEEKYGTILESIEDGYYELDLAGNFTYTTEVTANLAGMPKEAFIGKSFATFCGEENVKALVEQYHHVFVTGEPVKQVSYSIKSGDGSEKVLEASASLVRDSSGKPAGFRGIIRDMTARKRAEEALKESEERHRVVLEAAPDPVVVYDTEERVTYVNPAFSRVFGWTLDECLGRPLEFISDEDLTANRTISEKVSTRESFSGIETIRYTKDGRKVYVSASGAVFVDHLGQPKGSVITLQDITERKQTEEDITYLAYHDVLTGLQNRKSFYIRLEEELEQCRRRTVDNKWALLFLDLDRFKNVNDTLGHDTGDELLIEVGKRIKTCVRKSDHIFRLGGDEYTIILNYLSHDIDVAKVARKIREEIARPYLVKGQEIFITASIGISVYPDDGEDVEVLVRNADMAMYAAKEEGQGYRFFIEEMNQKALERMRLESSLRNALARNEFVLYYQPLVATDGGIKGMEALLRWLHPEMGLIGPANFIPLAEETGTIVPIGEWVLRNACTVAQKWQQQGFDDLFVAVNLSARQFREVDLVDRVKSILASTGLKPQLLKLEVTESGVMEDPEGAIIKMRQLRQLGIRFSIDDFGTGYSSLSYLKKFPIDTLKIDRSFVCDSTKNRDDQEIIKTIIAMAQNLNIDTVAEGVETTEQKDFLCQEGCRIMQGYYFGRPMPEIEFEQILQENKRRPVSDKNIRS